jgi:hypothetical protein
MKGGESDQMKEVLVWLRAEYGYCRSAGIHIGRLITVLTGALIAAFVTMVGAVVGGDMVMGVLGLSGVVVFLLAYGLLSKAADEARRVGDALCYLWMGVVFGEVEGVEEVRRELGRIVPKYIGGMNARYG